MPGLVTGREKTDHGAQTNQRGIAKMLSEQRSSKIIHCVGKLSIGPSPSQTLKFERRGGLQSQSQHASRGFQLPSYSARGEEMPRPG